MDLGNSFFESFSTGNALSYLSFLGLNQQPATPEYEVDVPDSDHAFLNNIPTAFEHLSVSYVKENLAVIPGEWEAGGISKCFAPKSSGAIS